MATKVSAEQLDAAAMSQFFQFLQCQLRLEAEEKLKQEVWLEDKDTKVKCLQTICQMVKLTTFWMFILWEGK